MPARTEISRFSHFTLLSAVASNEWKFLMETFSLKYIWEFLRNIFELFMNRALHYKHAQHKVAFCYRKTFQSLKFSFFDCDAIFSFREMDFHLNVGNERKTSWKIQ